MSAEVDEYDEDEMGSEEGEEGEEGEEEEQGGEEEEEGEMVDFDTEDLYSQPVEELVSYCKELEIDASPGTQKELATRILDELEKRDALEAKKQADARALVVSGEAGQAPSAAQRRAEREAGSVRNERLRGSLSWEERVKETEELKDAANAQFQAGANEVALTAYLAAVWLLKPARRWRSNRRLTRVVARERRGCAALPCRLQRSARAPALARRRTRPPPTRLRRASGASAPSIHSARRRRPSRTRRAASRACV
jgi:hypothetical protein